MKNSVSKRKKVRLRLETWVHKQRSGRGACFVTAEQHVAFESHAPWKLSNTWHKQLGRLRACSATADWAGQQVAPAGACAVLAEQHVAQVLWHTPRHVIELINKWLKQACSATADWAKQQVASVGACAVPAEQHVAQVPCGMGRDMWLSWSTSGWSRHALQQLTELSNQWRQLAHAPWQLSTTWRRQDGGSRRLCHHSRGDQRQARQALWWVVVDPCRIG
jgi:hypothetical protein